MIFVRRGGNAFFDDNIPVIVKKNMTEARRYSSNTYYTKRFINKRIGLYFCCYIVMKKKNY